MSKTCNNCKYSKRKMSEEPCFSCEENCNFSPQTNRQWLENMSDEKLAKTYLSKVFCDDCAISDYCKACNVRTCHEVWDQWLQAEHKE